MKIKIVSHACVYLDFGEVKLLCDPWLFGTCFNNGWSLKLKKINSEVLSNEEIQEITHIWISHEHPDHFHFPSLKFLRSRIKNPELVEIITKNDLRSRKDIVKSLRSIGFPKITSLDNLISHELSSEISIKILYHRHIDSALLVFHENIPIILNLNDCEISERKCNYVRKKFGKFPILLNQFSIAGFDGIFNPELMNDIRNYIIKKMQQQHISLGAKTTIPFASFCYFCNEDNVFLNDWHNQLEDIYCAFKNNKCLASA